MSNYIICSGCEKKIEFERPLFCPFCGKKLEPVDDLISGDESDIYPWSNAAPVLMKTFLYWLVAIVPLTLIFGKTAFIALSILLTALLTIYSIVYFLKIRKPVD